jgi:hypothetical protein
MSPGLTIFLEKRFVLGYVKMEKMEKMIALLA